MLALFGLLLSIAVVTGPAPESTTPAADSGSEASTVPTPPALPDSPAASVEPVPASAEPAEPAPVVEPAPATEPSAAPATPALPTEDALPSALEAPALDDGYVAVRAPRWRGTGQFIAAGGMAAAGIFFQVGDSLLCGECATGLTERGFLGLSMGLAAGGGITRGHADAYDDVALGRKPPNVRALLISGAVLTGAGAVLGLTNEGLWWGCVVGQSGPLVTEPDFDDFASFDCNYTVSRSLLDVASLTTATGIGLLTYAVVYRRDARAYARARVVGLRPTMTMGRGRLGLGLGGRF